MFLIKFYLVIGFGFSILIFWKPFSYPFLGVVKPSYVSKESYVWVFFLLLVFSLFSLVYINCFLKIDLIHFLEMLDPYPSILNLLFKTFSECFPRHTWCLWDVSTSCNN